MNILKLNLLSNGLDYLKRGLQEFCFDESETSIKYATLHIYQAIELILKERLNRVNPNLIFVKLGSKRTIYLDEAVLRLGDIGVLISKNHLTSIYALKNIRNELSHYEVTYEKKHISSIISNCIDFFNKFLKTELNVELKNITGKEEWGLLIDKVESIKQQYFDQAIIELERIRKNETITVNNKDIDAECPRCIHQTMVIQNRDQENSYWKGKCLICDMVALLTQCQFCGKTMVDYGGSEVCYRCGQIMLDVDIFEPNKNRLDMEKILELIEAQLKWFNQGKEEGYFGK